MSRLCLAVFVVLTVAGNLTVALPPAIQSSLAQGPRIEAKPTNCETHIAILDVAHKDAGPAGIIIMIGRLGDGERSREVNQHRLHSARAYLTQYHGVRSPDTIVIAEGERVTGYGRIELYVGGKLHTAFAIRRNADPRGMARLSAAHLKWMRVQNYSEQTVTGREKHLRRFTL